MKADKDQKNHQSIRRFALPIFLLALIAVIMWSNHHLEQVSFIIDYEERSVSHRFRSRDTVQHPFQPIYLLQDDDTLRHLGPHPWNRRAYGDFLGILHGWTSPSVVGFDYIFDEQGHIFAREGNEALARALGNYPNTVLAAAYGSGFLEDGRFIEFPLRRQGHTNPQENPPPSRPEDELLESGVHVGLINVAEPALLRFPAYAETWEGTYYALAIKAAAIHLGLNPENIRHDENHVTLEDDNGRVVRQIPLEDGQWIRINWFRPWHENTGYSLLHVSVHHGVLAGGSEDLEDIDRALEFFDNMRDRILLVGPADALSKDLSPTPMDGFAPRISVLGNAIETILSNRFVFRLKPWQQAGLTGFFALAGSLCILGEFGRRRRLLRYPAAVLVLATYPLLAYLLIQADIVISVVSPVICLAGSSLAATVFQIAVLDRKRARIQKSFQSYLSPVVVRQLVEQEELPQLGGERRDISALFTDIVGFSSFSEKMSPEDLVTFINAYLGEMTHCIMERQGTLDKYIGDAIVAFFGAPTRDPDQAYHALLAACDMMHAEDRINKEWPATWPDWPLPIRTRIGINSGAAIIGNMGSVVRFNYTMLGDSVNLAARCESAARYYGIRAMITENTLNTLTDDQRKIFCIRTIDRIVVKGKAEPVDVCDLWGRAEDASEKLWECHGVFATGFQAYLRGDWAAAESALTKSQELEPMRGDTNPSGALLARVRELAANPPSDWNGVYRMTSK